MNKCIIFCLMLLASSAIAQDAATDIRKINMFFTKENISMDLSYRVYADSTAQKPIQSETGKWIKSGVSQYNLLGKIESIRKGGEWQIVFDHDNKIAVLSDAPLTAADQSEVPGLSQLDEVIKQCSHIKYRSVDTQFAAYDLYPNGSQFYRITIIFDKKIYAPKKLVAFFANGTSLSDDSGEAMGRPRMEVDFKPSNINTGKLLEMSSYVIRKGENYELTSLYKGYQLNNYLLKN